MQALGLALRAQGIFSLATRDGFFVPTRMTFGSTDAPGHLASCMDFEFRDVTSKAYMDDIAVTSDDFNSNDVFKIKYL